VIPKQRGGGHQLPHNVELAFEVLQFLAVEDRFEYFDGHYLILIEALIHLCRASTSQSLLEAQLVASDGPFTEIL
jgi:hypothetical protein